jgi:glycosyltransferase involved in cell wall biosynthesis
MTVSLVEKEVIEEAEKDPSVLKRAAGREVVSIEFAGWLPCFEFFGDCGHHPQFSHTDAPPAGYRFVRSEPKPAPPRSGWGVRTAVGKAAWAAWMLLRPLLSIIHQARSVGLDRSLWTLADVVRLFFMLRRAGCRIGSIIQFLRTRHFASQVLLPTHPELLFLTSIPYTFGRHPWVIEIEDATTLLLPFHMNGCTSRTPIRRSPYLAIIKVMLESESCRGIITHMRSTAEALPKLFRSDAIAAKTSYIPCGVSLPPAAQDHAATDRLDLLFTCSWHQNPESFFLRGGLDVVRAFETIHERYPHVRLTLRTGLPKLKPRFRRVLEKCWVRVIDRYLPNDEMDELMRSTHLFILPAARIHVVSVLRAMAHGQVVVASDGWGFREYVEHGRNGMIVPGRYGKASWMDDETGMMRENYDLMLASDSAVTRGLVETISMLIEDHELRRRLGRQARHDVRTRYNLENWNRGLKEALDRAVANTDYPKELTCESV